MVIEKEDMSADSEEYTNIMDKIHNTISHTKGMLDSFTGAKVFAHWNATKNNASHPDLAAETAMNASGIQNTTVAAVTGRAMVGNLGGTDFRSFQVRMEEG